MTRLLTVLFVVFALAVPAVGQTFIATSATNADGYLDITTDDFGSWGSSGFGGPGDHFNPSGIAGPLREVTFSTTTYVFANGVDSSILSGNSNITALGASTMTLTPTSPGVASDTTGNGVNDTVVSAFDVTGGASGQELSFTLTQSVDAGPTNPEGGASAVADLLYTVTNNGPTTANLTITRVVDADMVWGTTFTDDVVGTLRHNVGPGVWMEEPNNPVNSALNLTTSASPNSLYYGGKQGYDPPNGPPQMNYGTASDVFDNLGIPASWQNLIGGLGYNVDGNSGALAGDGSIGAQLHLDVAPGATETFSFHLEYGNRVPEPGSFLLVLAGVLGLAGLRRR